jgi:hypothetical protein
MGSAAWKRSRSGIEKPELAAARNKRPLASVPYHKAIFAEEPWAIAGLDAINDPSGPDYSSAREVLKGGKEEVAAKNMPSKVLGLLILIVRHSLPGVD